VEVTDSDKHSSLLRKETIHSCKNFIVHAPGHNLIKLFLFVTGTSAQVCPIS